MNQVDNSSVLLLAGSNLLLTHNHRAHHLAAHARQTFSTVDVVSYTGFYEGPPTTFLKKAAMGIKAFLRDRVRLSSSARGRDITFRGVGLPFHLKVLISDVWFYICLRQVCHKHYRLCIFGHPESALAALLLKRSGIVDTLVYEDWDYFPSLPSAARNRFGRWALGWRECLAVRVADLVICVSQPLARLRRQQGAHRVEVVPNGVDYDLFARAQLKTQHPPTLIYTGSLSQLWGADLPIQALPLLHQARPDLRYILVGWGKDESRFKELAAEQRVLDRVTFVGQQSYEQLPRQLAEADIGVAVSRSNDYRQYASPLKVIEYMAAGLPVICTRVGDAAQIVTEGHAGAVIDFEPQAFAEAVLNLLGNPAHYATCVANATRCARAYDWNILFRREFDLITELAREQSTLH